MADPIKACREKVRGLKFVTASHAGLLLARYVKKAVPNNHKSKDELIKHAPSAAAKAADVYKKAFKRYEDSLVGAQSKILSVYGRMIVGLGGENVLETGITLHHTYGVPVIPGTALKGLAAHYCDAVFGWRGVGDEAVEFRKDKKYAPEDRDPKTNKDYREDLPKAPERMGVYFRELFGATDDGGEVIFHDAWIQPDDLGKATTGLVGDVMTPHHGNYYMADDQTAPTDFDDPNPVRFLSVAGRFLVAVSVRPGANGGWAKLAMDILVSALQDWGVGGKTSAGYGRMGMGEKGAVAGGSGQQANGGAAAGIQTGGSSSGAMNADELKQWLKNQKLGSRGKGTQPQAIAKIRDICGEDQAMLQDIKDFLRRLLPKPSDRSKPMTEFLAES
jgi:CRISPR type III-B/RAMP module RAMP protein Cmr6